MHSHTPTLPHPRASGSWVFGLWSIVFGLWPAAFAEELANFGVEKFRYRELHEKSENATAALRGYKVVEDDAVESECGKALAVALNKRLVRADSFPILVTPSVSNLKVGLYRATVRMKVHGMLNSLGSAVVISAGGQSRAIYLNEFDEEDSYQEFVLDFEVRDGDVVARVQVPRGGAPGGPSSLVDPESIPHIEASLKLNDLPWINRMSRRLVGQVVAHQVELKSEDWPAYTELVKNAILSAGGQELALDTGAKDPELTGQMVDGINQLGRSPASTSISLSFPLNITGRVRASRGASTPLPTLRKLFVDWIKVESLPEPNHIVVRDVSFHYPWRRPEERQRFSIWLHNRSGEDQTGTLRLLLKNGLAGEQVLKQQKISLPNGRYDRLEWDWDIPKNQRLWGQTVIAEVLRDDKVVSSTRTWFAIHPFSNAVMIHDRGNGSRYHHLYASYPRLRNHRECFGAACTIYDSAGVVPDPEDFFEPYVVGNGSYFMSIPTLISVTRGHNAEGIAPFFYLESNGSSQRAFEIYWDHPDWVPTPPANTDEFLLNRKRDTVAALKLLDYGRWKTKDGKQPLITRGGGAYAGQLVSLNGLIPENVDRVISGTLKLLEHAPFAGVRWDGLPFKTFNNKSLGGTFGKSAEELQQAEAASVARLRNEVRAKFPNFELRANFGTGALMDRQEDPFDFDKARAIIDRDLHVKELLKGHGSIMEEAWMGYAGFGNYKNVCRNYLRACHFESAAIKHAGGHHGHMLWFYDGVSQYTPDEIYQQLFSFFGGAHLDGAFGPIPDSIYDLGVFAVRFSEYFWDPKLRPIDQMQEKVTVDVEEDIWYAEAGFEKLNEKGNLLYVIPVINPPMTERWLQNRFGLLPAPIREPFGMTVQVPAGFKKADAVYLLDNRPYPQVKKLNFEGDEKEVTFEVPELIIFKVVVVEFGK